MDEIYEKIPIERSNPKLRLYFAKNLFRINGHWSLRIQKMYRLKKRLQKLFDSIVFNLPCCYQAGACSGKLSRKEPNFVTSGGNLHYYVTFWQKRKQSDFPNARCRFPKSDWTLRIGMYTVGDTSFFILKSKIWPRVISNIDCKNLLFILWKKTPLS